MTIRGLPAFVHRTGLRVVRTVRHPRRAARRARKIVLRKVPGVVHAGTRSTGRVVDLGGLPTFEKTFRATAEGDAARRRELEARARWGHHPWLVPITASTPSTISLPRLPDGARLDLAAPSMDVAEREGVAVDALDIALELHADGWAHRDLHAKNLFVVDGQLLAIDFELIAERPPSMSFREGYDLTGTGMPSPHPPKRTFYASEHPSSLQSVLGVPLDRALHLLGERLRDEARSSTATFKKRSGRHECATGRTYSTISVPGLAIGPDEAQRDCAARFDELGVGPQSLRGCRVIDLGCNIGGMAFEALRRGAASVTGVEVDPDKVAVARRLASFGGLQDRSSFVAADIDELEAATLGRFDVVCCFAIEAHVRAPDRLLELLAAVCGQRLYFEGNSGTDMDRVSGRLAELGFARVERLGVSQVDIVEANRTRGLLVAHRT